jgi:hypothetical protein
MPWANKLFLLCSELSFSDNAAAGELKPSALRLTKTQVQTYIQGGFAAPFLTGRRRPMLIGRNPTFEEMLWLTKHFLGF